MTNYIKNKGPVWYEKMTGTHLLDPLYVATSDRGLVAIAFNMDEVVFLEGLRTMTMGTTLPAPEKVSEAVSQLQEYLQGKRATFNLPLDLRDATTFQIHVLVAVQGVPYGEVRTYGDIAAQIGHPRAARAVGQANARNPLPIVIPCHRIIGSDGRLCGYSANGGLEVKQHLLQLERRCQRTTLY